LPLQGIRVTLDLAGQPAIWEVLADDSGVELVFVSRSFEAAAAAEFGAALPGRRYASERSLRESPNALVARVIEDGPVPMGPIVYVDERTRSVGALICRCMPAQVKSLVATRTYELLRLDDPANELALRQVRALAGKWMTFWPGEEASSQRLTKCLHIPRTF
jgi:hypothetical protein